MLLHNTTSIIVPLTLRDDYHLKTSNLNNTNSLVNRKNPAKRAFGGLPPLRFSGYRSYEQPVAQPVAWIRSEQIVGNREVKTRPSMKSHLLHTVPLSSRHPARMEAVDRRQGNRDRWTRSTVCPCRSDPGDLQVLLCLMP